MRSSGERVLALDPTAKGFGFASLEGAERLIDWGLVDLHGAWDRFEERLEGLLGRLSPSVLVLEGDLHSRRGSRARGCIGEASALALRSGIRVHEVTRGDVKRAFNETGSKDVIAKRLAELFPELRSLLPQARRAWMTEDDRMAIFDALSFALSALWESSSQ